MINDGKKFEEDFCNSFKKENLFIYRLKDSSSGWNNGSSGRFTTTNACDFISFNPIFNKVLLLECKSFKGKSCPFGNIKTHQIVEMFNYSGYESVQALFIFNFRELEQTYAVDVSLIKDFVDKGDRKSFSLQWCKENGVLIPQTKKKVRFNYDIKTFLNKSIYNL